MPRSAAPLGIDNIYLTGFMCSGKTSTGRLLAKRLRRPFRDTDKEVQRETGRSPAQIIRRYGLARFRRHEARALRRLARRGGQVIALGGGIALSESKWISVRRRGVVFHLACGEDELFRRLKRRWRTRPLAQGPDPDALRSRIRRLLQSRRKKYLQADRVVPADGRTPLQLALRIERALSTL